MLMVNKDEYITWSRIVWELSQNIG